MSCILHIETSTSACSVAVSEDGQNVFKKEDLKIEVNDGLLTVSSEREEEKNEEKAGWTRREYNYGSFTRSFQLPENTDGEHVTAKFTDGVLHLTVAKIKAVPERKAKHIAIS